MPESLHKLEIAPDLVEQVYGRLLEAISDGSLAPSTRITQEDIAEKLAVSRQPVLQALRLLKKDGFVIDAPGRGVLIAPLDPNWIANVYEVRSALDALAASLAARNGAPRLSQTIAQGRDAVRKKNINAMIAADLAFHTAIYHAAKNPLIELSARVHWGHIRRAMGAVLQVERSRETVWDEHEAIANAIIARKPELAEQLMRKHGLQAGHSVVQSIEQQLAQQGAKQ